MKQKLLNLFLILFVSSFSFAQVANQPSDLMVCDDDNDGYAEFDLTITEAEVLGGQNPSDYMVTYHETQTDAVIGDYPVTSLYTNVVSDMQVIYIRVEDLSSGNAATTTVNLVVNPLPQSSTVSDFIVCDSSGSVNLAFDLTTKDAEVLNGQDPSLFYVSYFSSLADAQTQTNALPSPWTNSSNPETIYVSILNTYTGCLVSDQSFDLIINGGVEANPSMSPIIYEQCDDNLETDGDSSNDSVQFDLSNMDAQVIGGQDPSEFTVSYFATLMDAEMGANPLPVLYQNVSNPQIIYARLGNNNSVCYDTTEATLLVNALPNFSILDTTFCQDESVTVNTGLNDVDYVFQWYVDGFPITGEDSPTLTIDQAGSYIVQVIDIQTACSSYEFFDVQELPCPDADMDGVNDSDEDINGNGNLDDDDTDNDGIPNYLDSDDDGDNVPTEVEVGGVSGRNSSTVLHQFIDTDNDSIENYLDNDDDGDGVLTIDEDYNNNGDPTDDDTNSNMIPDYLEAAVALNVNNFNVEAFKIYPNPAKATLYIQMDNFYSNVEVSIYDVQGKQIGLSKTLNSNITELDVSNFESGIYFVKLSNDEVLVTEKLVIQ